MFKPKLERKKTSPKSPMQIAQGKQPTVQGGRQNTAYEERSGAEEAVGTTVQPWLPRPARGGCHRPWWAVPFPAASVLCNPYFSRDAFSVAACFGFKEECIWS